MTLTQRIQAKIARETKYLGRDIGYLLGLDERFLKNARGHRILVYHGICLTDHTRFNPIFLTLKMFERHLQLYQKYFNVVSLDDYYQGNFSDDKFNVCITFDDGQANNHKYVLPLLERYRMPATFFITAIRDAGYDVLWNDFLSIVSKYGRNTLNYKNEQFYKDRFNRYVAKANGKSLADSLRSGGFDVKEEMMKLLYTLVPFKEKPEDTDYWLQMTEEQIHELSASSFATIGSHAYYHNDLAQIPATDATGEMVRSKQYLENIIQKPVDSFAFPYGTYTREVVEAAKGAGYKQLLATDFHFEEDYIDETMRERFTVNPFISPLNQMHATILRHYE